MSKHVSTRQLSEELGRNIKVERVRRGLTQSQLADAIRSTKETVSRWERGTSMPNVAMLYKTADVLGVSTDCLLGRKEEKQPESVVPPLSMPIDIAYRSRLAEARAIAASHEEVCA